MSWLHKVRVLGAVSIAPARFFSRLYEIAPYGDALRDWSDGLIDVALGRDMLELGCGPGDLSHYMADSNWQVTGVDMSEKMVAAARRLPSAAAFKQRDATQTGLEAKTFDAVISASLLNVVSKPNDLIAEMARLTRDDGVISVLIPTPKFTPKRAQKFAVQVGLRGYEKAAIEVWATAARKLEPQEVESWFSDAGFLLCQRKSYFLEGVQAMSFKRSSNSKP